MQEKLENTIGFENMGKCESKMKSAIILVEMQWLQNQNWIFECTCKNRELSDSIMSEQQFNYLSTTF